MKKISVAYHCGYGHTTNQARGIVNGIDSVENVTAKLIGIDQDGNITEADWQILDASDAIIFGSPTYMGMASYDSFRFRTVGLGRRGRPNERMGIAGWADKGGPTKGCGS